MQGNRIGAATFACPPTGFAKTGRSVISTVVHAAACPPVARSVRLTGSLVFAPGNGKIVSGACIQRSYDLVLEGLAWRPGVEAEPRFRELEREVKDRFRSL